MALRVFGFPLQIDRSWYFVVLLMTWTLGTQVFPGQYPGLSVSAYWIMGLIAAVMLFVCVLLHELGHSFAARAYGIPVTRVTLFFFGGVAQIAREANRPSVEFVIALAGPLVSVLLAGLCYRVAAVMQVESESALMVFAIVQYLAVINSAILIFNLLPGFPLDGGRILRSLIWGVTGRLSTATRIVCALGSGLGWILIGLGVLRFATGSMIGGFWYAMLGAFLRNAAVASARIAQQSERA